MTKSKRAKIVHLSKTVKKGRATKSTLIETIREAAAKYPNIYIFRVENMRNVIFKNLRTRSTGRFFIGKNKVMSVALGVEDSSECVQGARQVARRLRGDLGLFFTNESPEQVRQLFDSMEEHDFARTGGIASMGVVVEADPNGLRNVESNEALPGTVETQLREAGMPTKLRGGTILLTSDTFTVCEEGQQLTANQARILKIMGIKLATFQVHLVAHLQNGVYEEFESIETSGSEPVVMMEEDEFDEQ